MYKMPFGKWKGYAIDELPDEYFEWLWGQPWLFPALRHALETELFRRWCRLRAYLETSADR